MLSRTSSTGGALFINQVDDDYPCRRSDDSNMLTENFASPIHWSESVGVIYFGRRASLGSALKVRNLIFKKSFGRSLFDFALRQTYAYIAVPSQEIFEGDAEDKLEADGIR